VEFETELHGNDKIPKPKENDHLKMDFKKLQNNTFE
jgi:hypothetical protein